MATHLEQSLQREIDRIREHLKTMAGLAEQALCDCVRALQESNRQVAYSVILRDQRIDELEKETDRLCLEFLVRQQPVAGHLRFAYAAIKLNLELERIGDYAESIARQTLRLIDQKTPMPTQRFVDIANLSIPMLRDAVRAFLTQDAELARATMAVEDVVDLERWDIHAEILRSVQEGRVPLEALSPLSTIAYRFERVSDQAKNICQDTIYMCTGQYAKHLGSEVFRLLFVDQHNSCRSQMAEALANSLRLGRFLFASAGLAPEPIDAYTRRFLQKKGHDISRSFPKKIEQVPNADYFNIIVGLDKSAQKALPPPPRKVVYIDWALFNPAETKGTSAEIEAAYEEAYRFLQTRIRDLIEAVEVDNDRGGKNEPTATGITP
ncbi:MAG: phosphate signaling complex protein PhoU [Planctomycetes bacterium]|nr:phosphate signaling complex protein PhoU [Planctomycetota bacterium]